MKRFGNTGWRNLFSIKKRGKKQRGVGDVTPFVFTRKNHGKWYPTADGKRIVTDLLHLAELLQEAATLNESEAALLRWFEKQIQGEDRQKEQQVRLESELQLVKIVTIHKSKGLEYDLVWLPFIGYASSFKPNQLSTYFDEEQQQVLWDFDKSHIDLVQKEDFAEQLRLLYVALTRAKYQLVIGVPQTFEKK